MAVLFTWSRAVEFSETDAAGMAHFSNFYRWMEATEHAFVESRGVNFFDEQFLWPRVNASCDFKHPVKRGDQISVDLVSVDLGKSSLRYRFEIRVGERICALGEITTVCLSAAKREPVELLEKIRSALEPE